MHKPIIFMFSGQGSQYYGMGRDLYANEKKIRDSMDRLNELYIDIGGPSVVDEIYRRDKGIGDAFDELEYTHPAIFMIEYSLACLFLERGLVPDYLLGASLGEFTAAAVSGIISAEEALKALYHQIGVVHRSCGPGRMTAVIHRRDFYSNSPVLFTCSEMASLNYESHFVISGHEGDIIEVERYMSKRDILFQTLPVHYGFHSRAVDPALEQCSASFVGLPQKPALYPVLSCMSGEEIGSHLPSHFCDVIRKPILFQKMIRQIESRGGALYIDLGPYSTLASFAKRNLDSAVGSQCFPVMTPFHKDRENIADIVHSLLVDTHI